MKNAAADVVYLPALSSAVSLSVNFFPAYPAERCALNGKVKVVLWLSVYLCFVFLDTETVRICETSSEPG